MKHRKKSFDGSDRRQWRRLDPKDIPSLKGVSINQGAEARVMDISEGGILLHTEFRLRPEMKILLKIITTTGIFKITGMVLRSSIKSISGAPLYESAIAFENPLTVLDDLPAKDAPPPAALSDPVPDILEDYGDFKPSQGPHEGSGPEDPTILTVLAPGSFRADLDKLLPINEW